MNEWKTYGFKKWFTSGDWHKFWHKSKFPFNIQSSLNFSVPFGSNNYPVEAYRTGSAELQPVRDSRARAMNCRRDGGLTSAIPFVNAQFRAFLCFKNLLSKAFVQFTLNLYTWAGSLSERSRRGAGHCWWSQMPAVHGDVCRESSTIEERRRRRIKLETAGWKPALR